MTQQDETPAFVRYQIQIKKTPNILDHPFRFRVKVSRVKLAKHILKEAIQYRGKLNVILSRPCVYGVFSGPIGGFAPRESLCVGCLRCTTEHPDMVSVHHNPDRDVLGDSYFNPNYIDTVVHEAEKGHIPIRGAGYRGTFGGTGWDGMWTDMSEIVRPTRDGIHGREFISTDVDIGGKPAYLHLDSTENPTNAETLAKTVTIPIPLMFDVLPSALSILPRGSQVLSKAAAQLQTFAVMPIASIKNFSLNTERLIPLIDPENYDETTLKHLKTKPALIALSSWNPTVYQKIAKAFPEALIILRTEFTSAHLLDAYEQGVRTFHLTTNYHGRSRDNRFILDLIRQVHNLFVQAQCRNEITLIGSGGIVAAEHFAKALICGLDVVAINTPALAALQAHFYGECAEPETSQFSLPNQLTIDWGTQRLKNLVSAWHNQLLEIMGAMGIREVRRMRGEMGRAMFQKELENEAFAGIQGYERQ
ncbi:MAG: hypothetical protein H0X51_05660 [Parachlamydiaceae bacterium]|nr:hypothetical protein [Parachlamydiaceae bacterium]